MFTLTQYILDAPLVWGLLADLLFFGSLYFKPFSRWINKL